jgi:hypothetical protein
MTAGSVKDNLGQPVTDPLGRLPDRDSPAGEISCGGARFTTLAAI